MNGEKIMKAVNGIKNDTRVYFLLLAQSLTYRGLSNSLMSKFSFLGLDKTQNEVSAAFGFNQN